MNNNRPRVLNENGAEVDFEKALDYMEDGLKEEVYKGISPYNAQQFFSAYEQAHKERYGRWWVSDEKGLL